MGVDNAMRLKRKTWLGNHLSSKHRIHTQKGKLGWCYNTRVHSNIL